MTEPAGFVFPLPGLFCPDIVIDVRWAFQSLQLSLHDYQSLRTVLFLHLIERRSTVIQMKVHFLKALLVWKKNLESTEHQAMNESILKMLLHLS